MLEFLHEQCELLKYKKLNYFSKIIFFLNDVDS